MVRHYIICQHGLLGSPRDFKSLKEYFEAKPDDFFDVISLKSSSGFIHTLDGIKAGGTRCMNEILCILWGGKIEPGSFVSFIGHSMGGLFLRFALRQLECDYPKIFCDLNLRRKICFFVATPHAGIDTPAWYIRSSVRVLFRHVFQTAKDLNLDSHVLLDLCDGNGIASLNHFDRTIFYGNIVGDSLVSVYTALVLPPHVNVPIASATRTMKIEAYLEDHNAFRPAPIEEISVDPPVRDIIVSRMNSKICNTSRYVVEIPSGLPTFLSRFDNTAHHRIICHGVLDPGRVGMPMLEHIKRVLIEGL
jgi:hypothetical protein